MSVFIVLKGKELSLFSQNKQEIYDLQRVWQEIQSSTLDDSSKLSDYTQVTTNIEETSDTHGKEINDNSKNEDILDTQDLSDTKKVDESEKLLNAKQETSTKVKDQATSSNASDWAEHKTEIINKLLKKVLHNYGSQQVHVLLDHPFYELKFVEFPYAVKKQAARSLIVHAIGKDFLQPIDDLNFNYYSQNKDNKSHYVIYANIKELGENINSVTTTQKMNLLGIYPVNHWLFLDSLNKHFNHNVVADISPTGTKDSPPQISNMPLDFLLIDIDENFARIFTIKEGVWVDYAHKNFISESRNLDKEHIDDISKIQENVTNLIKLYSFKAEGSSPAIYMTVRHSKLLSSIQKIKPLLTGMIGGEEFSFDYLQKLYSKNYDQNQLLNMLRISNALVKDFLKSAKWIKFAAGFLVIGTIFLISSYTMKYLYYKSNLDSINSELRSELIEYDPNLVSVETTLNNLDSDFNEQQNIWLERKNFLARDYRYSAIFQNINKAISNVQEIRVSRIIWGETQKEITGIIAGEDLLTKFINELSLSFPDLKIDKNSTSTGATTTQFTLVLSNTQDKKNAN